MNSWLILPILALVGGLISLTPLGSQVLKREVVFIDLAVAQAAAAAVIWINFAFHFDSAVMDQTAATAGAVLISLGIAWITKKWQQQREALIGLVYVAGACMALLGASLHPHGKDKLLQLLAADVLWVDSYSVIALMLSAIFMVAIKSTKWLSNDIVFYAIFAVVTSLAVPALGLFLVFATLIAPALWIEKGISHWFAVCAAVMVTLLGLLGSWLFDTPSGPTITFSLTLFGISSLYFEKKNN